MRMTRRQLHLTRYQRGFAMITCYMILVVLMAMEGTFLLRSVLGKRVAMLHQESLSALYIAEGGVEQALQYLVSQNANPPTATVQILGGTAPVYAMPAAYTNITGSNGLSVTLEPDTTVNVPGAYRITASSAVGYSNRTVTVGAALQSFATYAYFTNNAADSNTNTARPWFRSGQTINGPVHANGYLRVMGAPTFQDVVTTSMDAILYSGGTAADGKTPLNTALDNPTYQKGVTLQVPSKAFPQSPAAALRSIAEPEGYVFKDSQFNFQTAGGVEVTGQQLTGYAVSAGGSLIPQYQTLNKQVLPLPTSGVLYDEGTATVKGTLVGQATIGAANVAIKDTLVYNSGNPVTNPSGTDILGLVADQNVYVQSNAPSNFEVDANIMALGSFRTGVDDAELNTISAKGNLTLYGSLAVNEGRPLGATDANGNLVHGYIGQYNYDARVKTTLQPPAFPKEQSVRILYWNTDKQEI